MRKRNGRPQRGLPFLRSILIGFESSPEYFPTGG
jgi:hypothetical protein